MLLPLLSLGHFSLKKNKICEDEHFFAKREYNEEENHVFYFRGEGGSFGARMSFFLNLFFCHVAKKERSEKEGNPPSEKKSSDIKRNASRTTKSAARAAPTVFFVLCDDNDDDQESDH